MNEIIPFGKYKGQPIEVLQSDPQYFDWLMAQDWFQQKFKNIYTVVVNNFSEPSETPEHNAMQVKVLDEMWRSKLLYLLYDIYGWGHDDRSMLFGLHCNSSGVESALLDAITSRCKKLASEFVSRLPDLINFPRKSDGSIDARIVEERWSTLKRIVIAMNHLDEQFLSIEESAENGTLFPITKVSFELHGFDAVVKADNAWYLGNEYTRGRQSHEVLCEMKPAMGDDFPAVLRQIKGNLERANNATRQAYSSATKVLILGRYTGVGATYDQMVSMFATEKIFVIMEASIDNLDIERTVRLSDKLMLAIQLSRRATVECCAKVIQAADFLRSALGGASKVTDSLDIDLPENRHFLFRTSNASEYEKGRLCGLISKDADELRSSVLGAVSQMEIAK